MTFHFKEHFRKFTTTLALGLVVLGSMNSGRAGAEISLQGTLWSMTKKHYILFSNQTYYYLRKDRLNKIQEHEIQKNKHGKISVVVSVQTIEKVSFPFQKKSTEK